MNRDRRYLTESDSAPASSVGRMAIVTMLAIAVGCLLVPLCAHAGGVQ